MRKIITSLTNNPLVVNSLGLMISSGVTALFGFVFWLVVARSFEANGVGLATTLLSMSTLLSLLGLAGFDTVFVRYLAKSKHRNEQINSGMVIAGLASAVIAAIFCVLVPVLSPKLGFVNHNPWYAASFIIFTVFTTWNTLTNAILVAYRRTSFIVVINIIFSAVKMVLPFAVHSGGPMMIFAFVGIAQAINVLLSVATLMKYFGYRPSIKVHFNIVRETGGYGLAAYIAHGLQLLPASVLPLVVLNKLGAAQAAYFYVAFTIAGLLYTIIYATNQSLLAETSYDEENVTRHFYRSMAIVSALIIPAIVIVVVFCPLILSLFGQGYASGAVPIIRVLSIGGIFVALFSLLNTAFKQVKDLSSMLMMATVNAVAIIGLALLLVKPYGLVGIGWAWLLGTVAAVVVGFVALQRNRKAGAYRAKVA